jgi:hypothetical protein
MEKVVAMFALARSHALAFLLTLLAAGASHGQAMLGVPTAVNPPGGEDLPAPRAVQPPPVPPKCGPDIPPASIWPLPHGAGRLAGPPACIPYEDRNGPLLIGDPLLDRCPGTPGWIAALELAAIVPHLKNGLLQPVTLSDGTSATVGPPSAELGARIMPKLELGYRFGQASGELLVAYRFIVAEGHQSFSAAEAPAFGPVGAGLRSRLDVQVLDIDYGSYEPSLGPLWDMKWRIGVRGVINYSDNLAVGALLAQQSTNRFWGIGPHASLDLRRWIGDTGFALFGRVDSSLPIGRAAQRFIDVTPVAAGETRLFQNMPQLSLNLQFGVTWSPNRCDCFRVTAGYIVEHWWDLGAIGVFTNYTREELAIQGGFLRAEWNY